MPAGDLLAEDWQHEVNGYLIGRDDGWDVESVAGWMGNTVRPSDVDLALSDGAVSTLDTLGARVITLNLVVGDLATAADVIDAASDLQTAWAPGADVDLHAKLPHLGHVKITGRCRDLVFANFDDGTNAGVLSAQATFYAADPTVEVVTP